MGAQKDRISPPPIEYVCGHKSMVYPLRLLGEQLEIHHLLLQVIFKYEGEVITLNGGSLRPSNLSWCH